MPQQKSVLHLLSQRPLLTGSGVTLEALLLCAAKKGWQQHVLCALPVGEELKSLGGLGPERLFTLDFETAALPFPIPGMSDVMPYTSSRFSGMSTQQLGGYRRAWKKRLAEVIQQCKPDLIHVHHLWLLAALVKDVAPHIPVVTHCHATGLRQMDLCPQLRTEVLAGCRRNEAFVVLSEAHQQTLNHCLQLEPERCTVIGAGYREEVFYPKLPAGLDRAAVADQQLLFVGKFSEAKGLPDLLDVLPSLQQSFPKLVLHVAGAGGGAEGKSLVDRMQKLGPVVNNHGRLNHSELAQLMNRCQVLVLPSFYEGLPLVLVEALACGCDLVATELAGGMALLRQELGVALHSVPVPRLHIDQPFPEDLPAFRHDLRQQITNALNQPTARLKSNETRLEHFRWSSVFDRLEKKWLDVLTADSSPSPLRNE